MKTKLPKALAFILGLPLSLALLLVAGSSVILFTSNGTRFALSRAITWYDGIIPGSIEVGSIRGTLGASLKLHNVSLKDASGKQLAQIGEFQVAWQPTDLFSSTLTIPKVDAKDVTVTLYPEEGKNPFEDLVPGGPSAEDSSPELGPNLPLRIFANLKISNFTLLSHKMDGTAPEELVKGARVGATAFATERRGELVVTEVTGLSPILNLNLHSMGFEATWNEPVLGIESLDLASNYGSLSLASGAFDFLELVGQGNLKARVNRSFVEESYGMDLPRDPEIAINFVGGQEGFEAEISLSTDDNAKLLVQMDGVLQDEMDIRADITVSNLDPGSHGAMKPAQIAGLGEVHIKGASLETAKIEGFFRCEKCRIGSDDRIDAEIDIQLVKGSGRALALAQVAGLSLRADAPFANWQPERVSWGLRSKNLSRPSKTLAKISPFPRLAGSLDASGTCAKDKETYRCRGKLVSSKFKSPWASAQSLRLGFSIDPLEEALPFSGTARARGLRANGQEVGEVAIDASGDTGRINLEAQVWRQDEYRLSTNMGITPGNTTEIHLTSLEARYRDIMARLHGSTKIRFDERQAEVNKLDLQIGGGRLTAHGQISRDGPSDLHLKAHQINLSDVTALFPSAKLDGTVEGEARLTGRLKNPTVFARVKARALTHGKVNVGDLDLAVDYSHRELALKLDAKGDVFQTVKAEASIGLGLDLEQGRVRIADNHEIAVILDANGIQMDTISTWFPQMALSGLVNVNFIASGSPEKPHMRTSINTDDLAWRSVPVGRTHFDLIFHNEMANIQLLVEEGMAREIVVDGRVPIRVDLTKGPRWLEEKDHEIDVDIMGVDMGALTKKLKTLVPESTVQDVPLEGMADIQARLRGSVRDPKIDLYAGVADLTFESLPIGTGGMSVSFKDHQAEIHAQVKQADGRYADIKSTIPIEIDIKTGSIDWQSTHEHRLALIIEGIDGALMAPLVTLPEGSDFRLRGTLTGIGSIEEFLLTGNWQGHLKQTRFPPIPFRGELKASHDQQWAKISLGSKTQPLLFSQVTAHIPRAALREQTVVVGDIPLKARVDIPGLNLKIFSPLLPLALHKASGTLRGRLVAEGTIANPAIKGRFELKNGAVTVAELNQRLKKIGFVATLNNTELKVEKLQFASGPGKGTGSFYATLDKQGRLKGQGRLQLKEFPFVKPGVPEGRINASLGLQLDRGPHTTDVDVRIYDTVVRLLERSISRVPKGISEGENLTFVEKSTPKDGGKKDNPPGSSSKKKPRLKLVVDLSDPAEIRGQGIDMRWAGKLTVISSGDGQNHVTGGIRSFPGRFLLLGNTFEIETGEVRLPSVGALDPYINIVANASTAEAQVTVKLRGRLSKPELILTSDPAMSQYQIVSLLVTGRSDTAEQGDEGVQTRAASLLLAFQNPRLERQLYSSLGIDRIEVALGKSVEEPVFVVGKRLSKRLYVETQYHHNSPKDENTVGARVEYWMSPSWTLESEYGDAQKGELGVYWRKRFDTPKKEIKP